MMSRHLAQAERHVAEGELYLARQRALIQKLERDGHGTRAARLFLKSLEDVQNLHLADRDRIRAQIRGQEKAVRTRRSVPAGTVRPQG